MTFSFNLVLALFLMAPGFAVFAGLYLGSQHGRIKSPPPPPGSILGLAIVTIGALAAHMAAAAVLWGQGAACRASASCFRLDHEPNPYATLFNAAVRRAAIDAADIALVLGALLLLTVGAFVAARFAMQRITASRTLDAWLYGWLADVAVATDPREVILAYVLSDVEADGTIVGYEGVVASLTTNADKEVTAILLTSCETFYLRVTQAGVRRKKAASDRTMPQLYLDRAHIKNIAFERVRFTEAAQA